MIEPGAREFLGYPRPKMEGPEVAFGIPIAVDEGLTAWSAPKSGVGGHRTLASRRECISQGPTFEPVQTPRTGATRHTVRDHAE